MSSLDRKIYTRPNASPGFWLCTLLPLCYLVNILKYRYKTLTFEYKLTTLTAIGFNLQSICFFLCLNENNSNSNSLRKFFYTFAPSTFTSIVLYYFLDDEDTEESTKQNEQQKISLFFAFAFSFTILFVYQYFHLKIFKLLPKSFTLGEASIILQGIFLFILNAIIQIPSFIQQQQKDEYQRKLSENIKLLEMQTIMMTALFALLIVALLLYLVEALRKPIFVYLLMITYVFFVCFVPVTKDFPILTIWKFITNDVFRMLTIAFYFSLVGLTTITIIWRLTISEKATTAIRKIFHLICVLVFLPGILYECTLLYIATGVALAFLIIFEMLRLTKTPPFYSTLTQMHKLFVDEKDAGYIAFTPIYLLIGCSLPLWMDPCSALISSRKANNLIPLLSGVLSIGIGDTAASVIGSKFGESKWSGTTKSIEGTLANVACQTLAIILLFSFGYFELTPAASIIISIAVVITSLIEAFTDQVDNLVLPMIFYTISSLS